VTWISALASGELTALTVSIRGAEALCIHTPPATGPGEFPCRHIINPLPTVASPRYRSVGGRPRG